MKILKLIASIIVCHLAGIIGSVFTVSSVSTWYLTLQKPFFTPPSWVFAPVWLTLYTLMGIALYLVLDKKMNEKALKLFGVQLVLNALWSILFFGLQLPAIAFVEIVILWFVILFTIREFYKLNKNAGWLLVPYIIWVTIASALNFGIMMLN